MAFRQILLDNRSLAVYNAYRNGIPGPKDKSVEAHDCAPFLKIGVNNALVLDLGINLRRFFVFDIRKRVDFEILFLFCTFENVNKI